MTNICVIIPIYNGEQYLERCLCSIFNQTYKNLTVICVNDGSVDHSLNILEKYKENLIIVNKENGGVSSARNAGLDYVFNNFKDSYISFVDCDDFLDVNYYEKMVTLLEESSSDIVCTSFFFEHKNKSNKYNQILEDKKFSSIDANLILLKDETVQSHSHCKLYVQKVWDGIRFPEDISWMEDQATIFKTFYKAENGVFISNYAGYHYWQEGQSACRSEISNKKVLQSINGYIVPFMFNFDKYNELDKSKLKKVCNDALANIFLMMFPRFNKKISSQEEKNELATIINFVKEKSIVNSYCPNNKKEKIKRFTYLYFRIFYKVLYNLFSN